MGEKEMNVVGLIPARAGSKRIPGKNTKMFKGKPLVEYTIAAAQQAEIFGSDLFVSTDDPAVQRIALDHYIHVIDRPAEYAGDRSPDIEWIRHALKTLERMRGEAYDAFFILRPTSVFRSAATIRRAWEKFIGCQPCHSLRSVRRVKERWQKMWYLHSGSLGGDAGEGEIYERLYPLSTRLMNGLPEYEMQGACFCDCYVQDGCVHIAWTKVLEKFGNITGEIVKPYFPTTLESFDLNDETDWKLAEILAGEAWDGE